jgi:hypothetical protein
MEDATGWRAIRSKPLNERRMDTYDRLTEAEVQLEDVRRSRGVPEGTIADVLDRIEAAGSGVETEDDLYLRTVSEYVAELGGHVEVRAVLPEKTMVLRVLPERRT